MPFDTIEEALLFDIRHALRTFKYAPPPKSHTTAMREWKDRLAQHILEHLLRAQWELRCKEARETGAGALIPVQREE
jgi:hypothetical protein